jgi:FtsZ-interacting cell division protein ZipA
MIENIKAFISTHSVAIIIGIIAIAAVIVIIMYRGRNSNSDSVQQPANISSIPQTTMQDGNMHDNMHDNMQGVETLNTIYDASSNQMAQEMQQYQSSEQEQQQYVQEIQDANQQFSDQGQYPM